MTQAIARCNYTFWVLDAFTHVQLQLFPHLQPVAVETMEDVGEGTVQLFLNWIFPSDLHVERGGGEIHGRWLWLAGGVSGEAASVPLLALVFLATP